MISDLRDRLVTGRHRLWGMMVLVIVGATYLGSRASVRWLVLLGMGIGAIILVQWPVVGLFALALAGLQKA